jgi:predicted acyl esterase
MRSQVHVFRAGHRIRLEISSSNFPRFDRNLNSEVVPADGLATELHQATQQVFHDTERASRLILPVVEGTLP